MEVNREAPAVARSEIEVAARPETVWDVVADLDHWPNWNPDVKSVSVSGPLAEGTKFKWKSGGATITSTLQRVDRPELLGWTGKAIGIHAVHVWHFERRGGKTRIRTEESLEGWLVRLFRGRTQKMLQAGLDRGMLHLKAEAERRSG